MKIHIKPIGTWKIAFRLPNRIILNSFTIGKLIEGVEKEKSLSKEEVKELKEGAKKMVKELQKLKKKHPQMVLLEVEAQDGTKVKISL